MSKEAVFLIANFPYSMNIADETSWAFVHRKSERDFPWLFRGGYSVILSGVGRGWRGIRCRDQVISHARWAGTGRISWDAVLGWITHFVDAIKASRQGDVIGIAPTPESGLGIAFARSLSKGSIRLVVRVIGYTASKALSVHNSRWRFRLLEWIESFVLRQADLVVPMGNFTKELAIRKGADPKKVVVLTFPVRWANSATVTSFPPQPCVLFVGRLEKEKGVHILLDAMRQVMKQVPSVRLFIVGDGSYRRELEAMADRLGLRGSVSFLGWLEPGELQRVYSEAWVLVLPSMCAEGLGMVLVEAGLMGRPVIGSNLGGIREIIQHRYNGFLVPPKDAKALAEAILTFLGNRDLAEQMGLANLQVARRYLEGRDEALEEVRQAVLKLVES